MYIHCSSLHLLSKKNIKLLSKLKYINLLEEVIYPTIKNNFEFFAVLKKAAN
jgi:hypothetical protein